jgi:hypothetical protein
MTISKEIIDSLPLPRVYGFFNGKFRGMFIGIAISEDGTMLAAHASEGLDYLIHDLGLDGVSRSYHNVYGEYYPDGWIGEFIEPKRVKSVGKLVNAIGIAESKKRQGKPYRFVSRANRKNFNGLIT